MNFNASYDVLSEDDAKDVYADMQEKIQQELDAEVVSSLRILIAVKGLDIEGASADKYISLMEENPKLKHMILSYIPEEIKPEVETFYELAT